MNKRWLFGIAAWMFFQTAGIAAAGVVDIDIVSDRGFVFPMYTIAPARSQGVAYQTRRAYVEAIKGERYGIRVRNNTAHRIGLVIAVDGRNIISGAKSYLRKDERMYILSPYSSAVYDGWRTAKDQVNRFYFTEAGDSYAGAWDDVSALGVIATAVYFEKVYYEPPVAERTPQDRTLPATPAPRREGAAKGSEKAESAPGTGFGEGQYSPSRRVDFLPEDRPAERHFLKYEWRETLCRKGFVSCRPAKNRFWDDEDYAPYPPPR